MSVFQHHKFPFLNEKYKLSQEVGFKSVKLTDSHRNLAEIWLLIQQYLVQDLIRNASSFHRIVRICYLIWIRRVL